ncbi:hypothetical protein YC2023_109506 [Brassica napus]
MDLNNNRSRLSTFPTYDHHHQAQPHSLQPYSYVACPVDQTAAMNPQIPVTQTGSEFGSLVCNPGFGQARGGFLDPHTAKMARINRKKAMIRSRNNSSPNSSSNELVGSRRQVVLTMKNNAEIAARKDLYRYPSFDNKKLRVLLVKHLKNSDVGSLGRIVLPKYFSIRKHADKPNEGREDESMEANDMNFYEDIAFDFIPKDEDEDSIAMLIGNLNDHYPNPNNRMDLPIDLHQHHQATSLPPADYMTNPQYGGSSNDLMSFNDFVW